MVQQEHLVTQRLRVSAVPPETLYGYVHEAPLHIAFAPGCWGGNRLDCVRAIFAPMMLCSLWTSNALLDGSIGFGNSS